MKSFLIATVALAGLLSITGNSTHGQASAGETSSRVSSVVKLENGDILDMVKAGLPEEIIVAKVQGSPGNFDTSPATLATLKSSQVPNAVILAMVKKSNQTNNGEVRSSASPSAGPGAPSLAADSPKSGAPQATKGCMAVRPIGSHAFRDVMLFGAAGALISHQQYQVVDTVDYPARVGQKYHGNDLQTIQGSGTKVVLLAKHYTAEDLHMACHQ